MNPSTRNAVIQLAKGSACAMAVIAVAACSSGLTPPPTLSPPTFTPAREPISPPQATDTQSPSATRPAIPSPVGTIPISPAPVIDAENVDLLIPLAEIALEGGGLAWSPDGQILAVGQRSSVALLSPLSNGAIRLLNAEEGTANTQWWFGAVAFSPDGREIAGGFDGMVGIWDVDEGILLHNYYAVWVTSVAYSPDGRWFAYSEYLVANVLDRSAGDRVHRFEADPQEFTFVAFSPDSHLLAGFGTDYEADEDFGAFGSIWETGTWTLTREFVSPGNTVLSFSPDSTMLADRSGLVDSDSGKRLRFLDCGEYTACMSLAFHPRENIVAAGLEDGTIRFFDSSAGDLLAELAGHDGWVSGLAFSPDARLLASVGDDKMVRLWGVLPP